MARRGSCEAEDIQFWDTRQAGLELFGPQSRRLSQEGRRCFKPLEGRQRPEAPGTESSLVPWMGGREGRGSLIILGGFSYGPLRKGQSWSSRGIGFLVLPAEEETYIQQSSTYNYTLLKFSRVSIGQNGASQGDYFSIHVPKKGCLKEFRTHNAHGIEIWQRCATSVLLPCATQSAVFP